MDDARARDERATNIFAGAAKAYADENLKAANGMATNEAAVFKDGIAMIVRLYSDRNDFAHNNGFFDLSPEERLPKLERILKDVERMRQFSTEERNGLGVAVEAHMRRHYRKEKGQWTVNLAASTEVLAARERKRAAQELKTTEPQLLKTEIYKPRDVVRRRSVPPTTFPAGDDLFSPRNPRGRRPRLSESGNTSGSIADGQGQQQ